MGAVGTAPKEKARSQRHLKNLTWFSTFSPASPVLLTGASGGLCTLPIPLLSRSSVEGVGMAALVLRLRVSREVRSCPEPISWPDPAGGMRGWPLFWYRFTSSIKVQCLPLAPLLHTPPPPIKSTRWGQAASRVGWGQRHQAAWEGNIKAKIKDLSSYD